MKRILFAVFVLLFLVGCEGNRGDQGVAGITGPSGISSWSSNPTPKGLNHNARYADPDEYQTYIDGLPNLTWSGKVEAIGPNTLRIDFDGTSADLHATFTQKPDVSPGNNVEVTVKITSALGDDDIEGDLISVTKTS